MHRWKWWLAGVCCACLLAFPALAGKPTPIKPADRSAVRQIISRQIAAFQADDAELAFSFASGTLQRQFGSAQRFMETVRVSYQPLYRPYSTAFLDTALVDGMAVQHLHVVDSDGRVHVAVYTLEHEPPPKGRKPGPWRITGCRIALSGDVEI